jgi:hypothetical protein
MRLGNTNATKQHFFTVPKNYFAFLHILPSVVELLFLLLNLAVNLLPNLAKLKLSPQDLVLLLLKSGLGLFQSRLELLLLDLEATALLVELVDGAASISQLGPILMNQFRPEFTDSMSF